MNFNNARAFNLYPVSVVRSLKATASQVGRIAKPQKSK